MPQASMRANAGLSAEGVSIAYSRAVVVENLDLVIPPNAFTALIGSNGSGKSTILKTLGGLLSPRAGRILLNGRPLNDMSTKAIARGVSMLAQGPSAPEGLTVLDLVRQGRYPHLTLFGRMSEGDDKACAEALALTGMTELAGRPLDNLSGGQRQRAWIAMTLAQETPILLLDEPTTFLDLAHQIEVMELVSRLVAERGKTVVAVLHDLNQAARYADHIVLLKAGAIAAAGRPEDVMTTELIADVFAVAVKVMPDPVAATPMCVPLALRHPHRSSDGE